MEFSEVCQTSHTQTHRLEFDYFVDILVLTDMAFLSKLCFNVLSKVSSLAVVKFSLFPNNFVG